MIKYYRTNGHLVAQLDPLGLLEKYKIYSYL